MPCSSTQLSMRARLLGRGVGLAHVLARLVAQAQERPVGVAHAPEEGRAVDAAAGGEQVLCDLHAGLTGADDEDGRVGQRRGVR